jgi:hypothetical protein
MQIARGAARLDEESDRAGWPVLTRKAYQRVNLHVSRNEKGQTFSPIINTRS